MKVSKTFYRLPLSSFVWGLVLLSLNSIQMVKAEMSPYDWALIHLDYARQEKVEQLRSFCDRIHALAQKAAHDKYVLASFEINHEYDQSENRGDAPLSLKDQVLTLRQSFNYYYIENYFAFYDILFVNNRGRIFYTIRNESDLNHDFIQHDGTPSELFAILKTAPRQEIFVDFHYYTPSAEAAAFFVEPVQLEDGVGGWIVLQCAINKVNSIFAWNDNLGATGETFLVNGQGTMLTESNFTGRSTILNKRLDDRNIQAKFADQQGHRTVTDYRGQTALTSFEVVEFLGTRWLVVAKMDEDEILTRHYVQHRRYYGDRIKSFLHKTPIAPPRELKKSASQTLLRIDMDEFLKADNGERLLTFGLATCTGLLVTYPEHFAYLAHVSPKDKVYGDGETNLLGQMVKRIKTFDIYPCEQRNLVFVVVATHDESLLAVADKLLEEGYLLSQIQVMINYEATAASMSYDYRSNELAVKWRVKDDEGGNLCHSLKDAYNLGKILQDLVKGSPQAVGQEGLTQSQGCQDVENVG